jgi:hypothetical protein
LESNQTPPLLLLLEERADRFVARAEALDLQLDRSIQGGLVEVLSLRGRDLSGDELHLEVVKSSHALAGSAMVAYEIGECGIQVLPDAEPRPTNGHLVNYRFAG